MGVVDKFKSLIGRNGTKQDALAIVPSSYAHDNAQKSRTAIRPSYYRTRIDWNPGDDRSVLSTAEGGTLGRVTQFVEAMLGDGVISGSMQTLTSGLIGLPMVITGCAATMEALDGGGFWKYHPRPTVTRIILWGILLGLGLGEYVKDPKTGKVTLTFVSPMDLTWERDNDTGLQNLYINGPNERTLVTPGNGRWFIFAPWGLQDFWTYGKWRPCGKAWLDKVAAEEQRTVFGGRHALGLTWVERPKDESRVDDANALCEFIASSPTPPVFHVETDWKVNHTAIGGEGYEQWTNTKEEANADIAIALTGQTVTSGQGSSGGWSKGDIHELVKQTIIDDYADALAAAFNECGMPLIDEIHGAKGTTVKFLTAPEKDKEAIGKSMASFGDGAAKANAVLSGIGKRVAIEKMATAAGIELEDTEKSYSVTSICGIGVVIEAEPGSYRSGLDENGIPWSSHMGSTAYGFIPETEGLDGDALDVFVGPDRRAKTLFVLKQVRHDDDSALDELKLFLGFRSLEAAKAEWMRIVGRPELDGGWNVGDLDMLRSFFAANKFKPQAPALAPVVDGGEPAPTVNVAAAEAGPDIEDVVDASEEPMDPSDVPAREDSIQLAADMTAHKLPRCEHKRVNECLKCGIERVRGVEIGPNGKPAGFKIAWRAIGSLAPTSETV